MDGSILQSIAPGLGDSSAFARVTPEAARRSSGYAVPGSASVHTRNDEQATNPTASYPIVCRRWRNGDQRFMHEGDFIFVNVASPTPSAQSSGRQPVVAANLQQVNTYARTGQPSTKPNLNKAENWRFFGVMRNEMFLGNSKSHPDRILNVDVRGRSVRVANLWPNSKIGDKVGFICAPANTAATKAVSDDALKPFAQYLPVQAKIAYYAGDPDGKLRTNLQCIERERMALEAAESALNNPPAGTSQRDALFDVYRAQRALQAKLNKTENDDTETKYTWMPWNFSQIVMPEEEDKLKSVHVGVISDIFRPPLQSKETMTRALTELNPRFELPTCEIFLRIS